MMNIHSMPSVRTYNYTKFSSAVDHLSKLTLSSIHTFFTICRDDWYGLLFSQTSSSKKANLVLGVFYPRTSLSWLGQFHYLGNRPENAVDPRLQSEEKAPMFPLPPPRPHSYQSPNNFFWAEEGVLQVYNFYSMTGKLCGRSEFHGILAIFFLVQNFVQLLSY